MNKKYESDLLASIHETAEGLNKIGLLSDKEMREYDRDCLDIPKGCHASPEPTYESASVPAQPIPAFASSNSR